MLRPPGGGFLAAILLVAGGLVVLLRLAMSMPEPRALTVDERDYLSAASNLARHGVFSSARPSERSPAPDAYREPGYPALVALSWRLLPLAPPATDEELEAFAREPRRGRALLRLNALLLFVSAVVVAALVARLAGGTAGALAFLLVASSPALQSSARLAASENLAAPLTALATLALVVAVERGAAAAALAGVAAGALPVVRGAGVVVIVVGALVLILARPRELARGRWRRVALFIALAVAPTLLWQLRNLERLGHFVLTDRGGLVLTVRAELDREVARHGALVAALAWTPLEAARSAAERRAPEARFDRPTWTGETFYFARAIQPWWAERARGSDPFVLDRRLRKEALAEFVAHPVTHLAAGAAVAWRALFVERSPEWMTPLDLRFLLGLLFLAATVGIVVAALRGRDARLWALAAPPLALFLFHALTTEFLPRFALPLLPLAWGSLALIATGGVAPQPESGK